MNEKFEKKQKVLIRHYNGPYFGTITNKLPDNKYLIRKKGDLWSNHIEDGDYIMDAKGFVERENSRYEKFALDDAIKGSPLGSLIAEAENFIK